MFHGHGWEWQDQSQYFDDRLTEFDEEDEDDEQY